MKIYREWGNPITGNPEGEAPPRILEMLSAFQRGQKTPCVFHLHEKAYYYRSSDGKAEYAFAFLHPEKQQECPSTICLPLKAAPKPKNPLPKRLGGLPLVGATLALIEQGKPQENSFPDYNPQEWAASPYGVIKGTPTILSDLYKHKSELTLLAKASPDYRLPKAFANAKKDMPFVPHIAEQRELHPLGKPKVPKNLEERFIVFNSQGWGIRQDVWKTVLKVHPTATAWIQPAHNALAWAVDVNWVALTTLNFKEEKCATR